MPTIIWNSIFFRDLDAVRMGTPPSGRETSIIRSGRPLKEHVAVPKPVRLMWGGLKNLLSGATTVAHHNPYEPHLFDHNFPVRVIRKFGWAHSLHFSPDLAERFRQHATESAFHRSCRGGHGRRLLSRRSKDSTHMGVLDRRTVLVHAIALKPSDIEILQARKCSIVWCPSSNLFTYGRTFDLAARSPRVSRLRSARIRHSRPTAIWSMRSARQKASRQMSMERIFEMVTTRAASIFRLPKASGEIQEHGPADLVAVADHGQSPADALNNLVPDLVMIGGRIRLLSRRLSMMRNLQRHIAGMQRISVEPSGEWFVDADISLLHKATAAVLGPGVPLGWKVCIAVIPVINTLPVLVVNPYSRCNCRCVMCDIWQGTNVYALSREELERQ